MIRGKSDSPTIRQRIWHWLMWSGSDVTRHQPDWVVVDGRVLCAACRKRGWE